MTHIIVTGSIAYDYLMRFPGRFADHFINDQLHQISLSFLVEDMTRHWGGVAANIAYNMALLGLRPKLMGTAGRDFPEYRMWLEGAGVDTSTVRQIDDVFTASFFANTDVDNNQIASFYSGAMAYASDYTLQAASAEKPDYVLISPNDPRAMLNLAQECRENAIHFVYDPSQQVARFDGDELRHGMEGAYAMVVNAYEAEVITRKTGLSIADLRAMVNLLIITQGESGSCIYADDTLIEIPAFPPDAIQDPTGVGDAYRAGLMLGISRDWSLELTGRVGALCAAYALEQVGPQSHHFEPAAFVERFRTRFDDDGALDALLEPRMSSQH